MIRHTKKNTIRENYITIRDEKTRFVTNKLRDSFSCLRMTPFRGSLLLC